MLTACNAAVRQFTSLISLGALCLILSPAVSHASAFAPSGSRSYYRNFSGYPASARVVRYFWREPIVHPPAQVDSRIDPKLERAATIAQERANAHSMARCWPY